MDIMLRFILIIGSIIAFALCIKRMQQSKLKATDSVIWMTGSAILILMSIFSGAVTWISEKLGFIAPVNFVFFVIITFLLIQVFMNNIKISMLNNKIRDLNRYIALKEKEENKNEKV